jgi:putative tryptophan/tyrosine transport system substrate-binding protein
MNRRALITLIGGAAASGLCRPRVAHAQHSAKETAMPVIGFLHPSSLDTYRLRAFRQGLKDAGFVEGDNVAIEYRWADNQVARLPALAAELVSRRVAVIVTVAVTATVAAQAATKTTPVVFMVADDPVRMGLVASLARPGGNLTGFNVLAVELAAKRLELLRDLVPGATRVAALVNPAEGVGAEATLRDLEAAARATAMQIQVLNATTLHEIDAAFAALVRERPDALFVGTGPFLTDRRVQLAQLTAHQAIPATYQDRQFVEVGGLMSYGASLADGYRHIGTYAGRILKGAKPADLPVVQSSKFELVINHSTARMLGLTVPPSLLATADEVIE